MTRPLPRYATPPPDTRPRDGHPGLWFDKFCDRWRIEVPTTGITVHSSVTLDGRAKLEWIETLTKAKVGSKLQLDECASRLARLIDGRGGRFAVLTTKSRFVTGLGRSHPVENGFAWHPTLGTPYLPGSSIKGLMRAWARLDADPSPPCETVRRLLGDRGKAGGISFLDAVPIAPVQLEADVMTPHYAGWTKEKPPGDWCSPTPIPFLVAAAGTSFLFGVLPGGASADDLCVAMSWLGSALTWNGAGAKTAVGYGRFATDDEKTAALKQRLRDEDIEAEERIRAEREARQREKRLAALTPTEREIEEVIDSRKDPNLSDIIAVMQAVESGRWVGAAKLEVAQWLRARMEYENRWKEVSQKKNPARDREHQNTLRVSAWLEGG